MSRATACFSMYSDMSMRIIACSSSKRNSASALAVSVLPTPVGPRKMNEPIGRFGSCSPERARRTALDTASIASRWPITRLPSRSSMWTSFWTSPSISRETGMPVHFATTSAMSSASTSSLRKRCFSCSSAAARPAARTSLVSDGNHPELQLGRPVQIALTLGDA